MGAISRIRRHALNGVLALSFGVLGVNADVISHANVFCQAVQGFWGSEPPSLPPKFCYLHRIGWSILQQRKHCRATL